MSALLEIEDLHVEFALRPAVVRAVEGVSLSVDQGETVALVGESGSGKSTTAMAVPRLNPEPPARYPRGRIRLGDNEILECTPKQLRALRGREVTMIFQDPMATLNPLQRVGTQVAEVLKLHGVDDARARRERSLEALVEAGITEPERRASQYPHQLSGGLRQRVMIAMAVVGRPRLLIADEPTTALDVTVQAEILALLRRLQAEHDMAVLLITHDLGVVASLAHRVAVMTEGQIVEQGDALSVFTDPQHAYTRQLLDATPRLEPAGAEHQRGAVR